MKKYSEQIIAIFMFLLFGAYLLTLYEYFSNYGYKFILYAAAIIVTTLGVNQFVLLIERLFRKTDVIRHPFARIAYSLVPCIFFFYQFYRFDISTSKIIIGILIIMLVAISIFLFSIAFRDVALARRRIPFIFAFILYIVFFTLSSFFTRNVGILLLYPLSLVLSVIDMLRFRFFRDIERRFFEYTLWTTGSFSLVYLLMLSFNLIDVEIVSTVYTSVIAIFIALVALAVALTVYVITQRRRNGFISPITLPTQGLALFCFVLLGLALLGRLIGTQINPTIFYQGTTLQTVFSDTLSVVTLFRILVLDIVFISIPFALIYAFAIIRHSLTNTNV